MTQFYPPLEEYKRFTIEFMGLQFNFLWQWLQKHPEEDIRHAIRHRIDLCRKTDTSPKHFDVATIDYNRPEWIELENKIIDIFSDKNLSANPEKFEETALSVSSKILIRFAELTWGSNGKFIDYQCGSLKYDTPEPNKPYQIMFHIGNAVSPKSIFEDRNYLKNCFLMLMDQTEKKFGAKILYTHSWLNSLPKWLEYFPEEWLNNLGPEDKNVSWGYGHWGQFISAKGVLNEKYAKFLRETGEFPFWPRSSTCSFSEMRKHLATL